MSKHYETYVPHMRAVGSRYWPLQCCDANVLCPDCGGYGMVPGGACRFCDGAGTLAFTDPRIVPANVKGLPSHG